MEDSGRGPGLSYGHSLALIIQLPGEEDRSVDGRVDKNENRRTKSRHEPPPKYSMTIHSLCPLKKLSLYCVTNGEAHVLKTEISCWISWISSSLDSRSICSSC